MNKPYVNSCMKNDNRKLCADIANSVLHIELYAMI